MYLVLASGSLLLAWGCGGGDESAGQAGPAAGLAAGPAAGHAEPAPTPAAPASPEPTHPEPASAPSGSDTAIAAARINALTATDHSMHYISPWFIAGESAYTPTMTAPRCYPEGAGDQAGAQCYYLVDDLSVSHRPDDFTFSNVRRTGTLPDGIPRLSADVTLTPSATDATDAAVEVVFPAAAAAYTFLGGWLEHGAFGVLSTDQGAGDSRVVGWIGLNFGIDRVTTNPVPSDSQIGADPTEATWTGAMIGKTDGGSIVTGGIRLTYHFNDIVTGPDRTDDDTVSVSFHDVTGDRSIDPFEGMLVRDATFGHLKDSDRRMEGGFIGPKHSEEVVGHFRSNSVTGAFGGKREP